MLYKYTLSANKQGLYDITPQVREAVSKSGVSNGVAIIYCPHTTAAITINENGDPDVKRDIVLGLDKAFPDRAEFRHFEGNSAAHLKASTVGTSESIIIDSGEPVLGTWQSVYFCEFDPPRSRTFYVKILNA